MIVGVPKEIKPMERRVALVPAGAAALVNRGHRVLVESDAGAGCGYDDVQYAEAGAVLVADAATVFGQAGLVLKVKEPQPVEYDMLRSGQVLFTFLHLAASAELTHALLRSRCVAIAYEAIEEPDGSLPILSPMSEIAGRLAVQIGSRYLESTQGGVGRLLSGATGVARSRVVVVGGGVVGEYAARMAAGMGADVIVLEKAQARIRQLDRLLPRSVTVRYSDAMTIAECVPAADLLVGAVLARGHRTPRLVGEQLVARMKPGAVIVDVSVDQGGCVETIHPTTHAAPVYEWHGVRHCGVANLPAAAARTATDALTASTIDLACAIADLGVPACFEGRPLLRTGLVLADGVMLSEPVAEAMGLSVGHWPVGSARNPWEERNQP